MQFDYNCEILMASENMKARENAIRKICPTNLDLDRHQQ